MGQKVNPISFRLLNGNLRTWSSNWFRKRKSDYVQALIGDLKVQNYFRDKSSDYSVCDVLLERGQSGVCKVVLNTGKVSVVIGKNGDRIKEIENDLKKCVGDDVNKFSFSVKECKRVYSSAGFVAGVIVDKLQARQSFKRAVKSAMEQVMKSGAVGVKISVAGRLNGAEIARTEKFKNGIIPLHTLRAQVDYACKKALTTYGVLGVKVWICNKM